MKLILLNSARQKDIYLLSVKRIMRPVTFYKLYDGIFNWSNTRIPALCRGLEQIVSDGKEAMAHVPSQFRTSKQCIFRVLYGEPCYIDNDNRLHIGYNKRSMLCSMIPNWAAHL